MQSAGLQRMQKLSVGQAKKYVYMYRMEGNFFFLVWQCLTVPSQSTISSTTNDAF